MIDKLHNINFTIKNYCVIISILKFKITAYNYKIKYKNDESHTELTIYYYYL